MLGRDHFGDPRACRPYLFLISPPEKTVLDADYTLMKIVKTKSHRIIQKADRRTAEYHVKKIWNSLQRIKK